MLEPHNRLVDSQNVSYDEEQVAPTEIDLGGKTQSGINFYVFGNRLNQLLPVGISPQGIIIFADRYRSDTRVRKTAVHEIAHSFQIGEVDDDCERRPTKFGEIYSGEDRAVEDLTPEEYDGALRWSVMSAGWSSALTKRPMSGDYFAFSIEELLTTTMKPDAPCYG